MADNFRVLLSDSLAGQGIEADAANKAITLPPLHGVPVDTSKLCTPWNLSTEASAGA